MQSLELLIWGSITIIGVTIGMITLVLALFFMLTKTREKTTQKKKYDLNKQKEI